MIGQEVNENTTVFPPFYTNVGKHIYLGRNVFINHACSFLDLGSITIENDVMLGPRVNITSQNHPAEVKKRKTIVPAKVVMFGGGNWAAQSLITEGHEVVLLPVTKNERKMHSKVCPRLKQY